VGVPCAVTRVLERVPQRVHGGGEVGEFLEMQLAEGLELPRESASATPRWLSASARRRTSRRAGARWRTRP